MYDREETLENKLNAYNPNDSQQIKELMQRYFFNTTRIESLGPMHREELKNALLKALASPDYDFTSLLKDNDEKCFYLPSEWNIENPRRFFEVIYKTLNETWS